MPDNFLRIDFNETLPEWSEDRISTTEAESIAAEDHAPARGAAAAIPRCGPGAVKRQPRWKARRLSSTAASPMRQGGGAMPKSDRSRVVSSTEYAGRFAGVG